MSKVYVANTTLQNAEIHYRMPIEFQKEPFLVKAWSSQIYRLKIPAGGQTVLQEGRNFSQEEFEGIFSHQARYFGARRASENVKGFVGHIWSLEPIKIDRIQNAIEQNKEAANRRTTNILNATAQARLDIEIERARSSGAPPPERVTVEVAADKSPDIDVGGLGTEALREGVEPSTRPGRRRAA